MVHGLSVKVVFLCLFSKCSFRNASPCAETRGHAFAYHNLFVYHDFQSEDIIQLQSAGIRSYARSLGYIWYAIIASVME